MTIVLTGGGSGGHITPILAVAAELKRLQPKAKLVYIGQKGDNLGDIPAKSASIDEVYSVRAGKFRRFHGEGFRQLLDVQTTLKNMRDVVYVLIGCYQSWRLLKTLKPSVVFIKGGFVGVPVGLAASRLGIPYITHDSDVIAGLANRLIAGRASKHAVAMSPELYKYPADKTIMTGIPLQADFVPVNSGLQAKYRAEINLPKDAKVLFVIGGGLGSQRVNQAVADAVPHLLREFPDLYVVHSVGRINEDDMAAFYAQKLSIAEQGRLKIQGYLDDVFRYSGAADLVITRAGATNLAEFALQGKACIVIPSPFLAGGHQLKNAQYLSDKKAVAVIDETELTADPNRLARQVSKLLRLPDERRHLGVQLAKFAMPEATRDLAELILEQAKGQAA